MRLERMLQAIGPDVIYCDTDSIKFTGSHQGDFRRANKELQRMAEEAGAYADNEKGKRYYLGTWDPEHEMTRFKTLGSKKYLYEIEENGKRTIFSTIAGVKKKRGKEFFNKKGFKNFTFVFSSSKIFGFVYSCLFSLKSFTSFIISVVLTL